MVTEIDTSTDYSKYACFGCTWVNSGTNNIRISFSNPIQVVNSGCTLVAVSWSDGSNPDKTVHVNDPISSAYIFNPPTLSSTDCTIDSYSIINIANTITTP